uniref:YukJ family protein n=1 Tax=Streptomyces sp. NBC_00049 TaxID=2903617 RepID=A0AAU2K391_9ACTN
MPLEAYGVLSGTLHRHFRDQPDAQDRWFRVDLEVDAPAGRYRCAVDVDGERPATGVRWKVFTLAASVLEPVPALAPGYHDLWTGSGSGAIDHLRHPALVDRPGFLFVRRPPAWLQGLLDRLNPPRPWIAGSGPEAARALEGILVAGRPVLVFGEPFADGLGMRAIHQNQGDPHGSPRWGDSGVWQDGAVLTRRPDGRYDVFLSRFADQADRTDADGHPA